MNALHDWFLARTAGTLRALVAVAIAAVLATGALVFVTGNDLIMPWVGACCGIIFYGAAYTWLQRSAPDEFFHRVNVKGRMEIVRRRGLVIVSGLVWSAGLLYMSQVLPNFARIAFGALQIVVVIALVNVFRATDEELEDEAQALAEAQAAQAALDEQQEAQVAESGAGERGYPVGGAIVDDPVQVQYPQEGAIPPPA